MAVLKMPMRIQCEPFIAAEMEFDTANLDAFRMVVRGVLRLTLPSGEVVSLGTEASRELLDQFQDGSADPSGSVITDVLALPRFTRVRD